MNNQTPTKGASAKQPRSGKAVMIALLSCAIIALVIVAIIALYRGKREKAFEQFVAEKQTEQQRAFAEYLQGNASSHPTERELKELQERVAASSIGGEVNGQAFFENIKEAEKDRQEAYRQEFRNQ